MAPLLALLFLFSTSCALLKGKPPDVGFVAPELAAMEGQTLAVLPFENQSDCLGADYLVTDEMNLRLGMTGKFRMIERVRVQDIYREQDFDPARISDSEAVAIGRMLGARMVVLGHVSKYLTSERPPEIPLDAFPVMMPVETETDVLVAVLVNTVAAIAAFVTMRPAVAEVSFSARIVDAENGQILWQAKNSYRGDDKYLRKRRPPDEWDRLKKDVVFLSSNLCSEMAATLVEGMAKLGAPSVQAIGGESGP